MPIHLPFHPFNTVIMNLKDPTDRTALKELVDKISTLGDRKDFNAQV